MSRWKTTKDMTFINGDATETFPAGSLCEDYPEESLTWQERQSLVNTRRRAPAGTMVRAVRLGGRLRILTAPHDITMKANENAR